MAERRTLQLLYFSGADYKNYTQPVVSIYSKNKRCPSRICAGLISFQKTIEPLMRIELTTSSLPRKCSTPELQRLVNIRKSDRC